MNRIAITSSLLALLIAQAVCWGGVPPEDNSTGGGNSNGGGVNPADNSIGTIARISSSVRAGLSGSLLEVTDPPPYLYNNYSVKLADGGKATLAFHNDITLTLYNNTETGGIYGEVDPNVPNYIRMKLERGGLLGQVANKGNTAEISVAYGSTIRVVGTAFYVVYDEDSYYTSVGNFDGELYFNPNGAGEIFLPQNTQVDIAPDGTLYYYELPNDPGLFDGLATETGSPLDGLRTMREKLGQPAPGSRSPGKPITTVLRTLFQFDGSTYTPDLAESWEVNDFADVVTFHLQKEILLSDGTLLTATVVRERLEKDFSYAQTGNLKIETADDFTLICYLFGVDFSAFMKDLSIFEFEVIIN